MIQNIIKAIDIKVSRDKFLRIREGLKFNLKKKVFDQN